MRGRWILLAALLAGCGEARDVTKEACLEAAAAICEAACRCRQEGLCAVLYPGSTTRHFIGEGEGCVQLYANTGCSFPTSTPEAYRACRDQVRAAMCDAQTPVMLSAYCPKTSVAP